MEKEPGCLRVLLQGGVAGFRCLWLEELPHSLPSGMSPVQVLGQGIGMQWKDSQPSKSICFFIPGTVLLHDRGELRLTVSGA